MTTTADPRETAPAAPTRSARVYFVDVLRLIASFQMVNGHTLDALMVTSIRTGAFYDRYIWFRGLVSVSFLVVAGIAFHLSTLCRYEKHKADRRAVRRRYRRATFIILIGYLLRFPWGAFRADPALRESSLDIARAVDILHCIGFTLLILETITLISTRRRQVVIGTAIAAAILFLAAPFCDALISDGRAHFFLNWISHQGGSPFPLFPWSGFVCVGVVVGALVFRDGGRSPFPQVFSKLVLLCAATWAAYFLLAPIDGLLYDSAIHHGATDPRHCVAKVGTVLVFLIILAILCRPIRKLPAFFAALSQETLTVYALHLLLLYAPGLALARRFEHRLELPFALLASAGMMVATLGSAYLWHRFKKTRTGRELVPRKGSSDA